MCFFFVVILTHGRQKIFIYVCFETLVLSDLKMTGVFTGYVVHAQTG